jgi:hypothetical protein
MRANTMPISSGVIRARFWIVSLVPAVWACEVPEVVPSVSLVPVVQLSDVPSLRDREVVCDAPRDWPSVQPLDFPCDSLLLSPILL